MNITRRDAFKLGVGAFATLALSKLGLDTLPAFGAGYTFSKILTEQKPTNVPRADCVQVRSFRIGPDDELTIYNNKFELIDNFTTADGGVSQRIGYHMNPTASYDRDGNNIKSQSGKLFMIKYDKMLLDRNGVYHPLYLEFSDLTYLLEYDPEVGTDVIAGFVALGSTIMLYTTNGFVNKDTHLAIPSSEYPNNNSGAGLGILDALTGVTVRAWSDADLTYNFSVRDLDAKTYFKGNVTVNDVPNAPNGVDYNYPAGVTGLDVPSYARLYSESVEPIAGFSSTFYTAADSYKHKATVVDGQGVTHVYNYAGSKLVLDGNRVHGSLGVNSGNKSLGELYDSEVWTAGFVNQITFGGSRDNAASFTWRAESCGTTLFHTWSYTIVEKAAEGGHNDQIAGTDASATPIDLPEVAPGETPYTTRSDLLAIPRNNYTVHVQADPGWYVSEVLVDGVAQDLGEGFPRTFDVPFENVTADHVVKSKFERYGYVTIGKRFDDGSSPVIVQPTHPYS